MGRVGREVVLLCTEDDDFAPPLVRIVDEGIRRAVPLEVVVLAGADPMPPILFTHPRALLVLLRSEALDRDQLRAVRRGFIAFCRPAHALWEVWLADAARPARLVAQIERELRSHQEHSPTMPSQPLQHWLRPTTHAVPAGAQQLASTS